MKTLLVKIDRFETTHIPDFWSVCPKMSKHKVFAGASNYLVIC